MAPVKNILNRVGKITGYDRLEFRERIFLTAGIVFVLCFLVFQGIIAPYLSAKEQLERSLQSKKNDVLEMTILQKEYLELLQRQGEIARMIELRNPNFSLFSFLDRQADAVKVKSRIKSMKPSTAQFEDGFNESSVEIKMEAVTLNQVVEYLLKIESLENVVVVKRLAVQKNKKEVDLLDVVMNVVTFENSAKTNS